MSHSERMSSVDTTWLRMDRPANPMMIVAVWVLEGPVALDKVEKQIADGLHELPALSPEGRGMRRAGVYWRDDPNFDPAHHVKRVKLPGRGGKAELERFVGELASEPLDPNRPLWMTHIVEEYEGGAALVTRMHHAIADGIALKRVTMALVDGAARKGRRAEPADEDDGWLQSLMAPVVAAINAGTQASISALGAAFALARHPLRAANLLRDGAGVAGELGYLLFMSSDSADPLQGQAEGLEARRLVRAAEAAGGQGGEPGARLYDQRLAAFLRRRRDAPLPQGEGRQDGGRRSPRAGSDRPAAAGRSCARQPLRRRWRLAAGRRRTSARAADYGPPAHARLEDLP